MNNAMYFETLDRLQQAFKEFAIRRGNTTLTTGDALAFARAPAMTTLEWKVGDIVQFSKADSELDGHYATIVDFGANAYSLDVGPDARCVRMLYLKFADDRELRLQVLTDNIRKPDFPPGLVELVKAQLAEKCHVNLSKCPLKKESACMEKEVAPCLS